MGRYYRILQYGFCDLIKEPTYKWAEIYLVDFEAMC